MPILVLVAAGALFRFVTLGDQSFWSDESHTLNDVRGSLADVFSTVRAQEGGPPLYFVVLWGWGKLFGLGEVALRSFSALCGTATIPVAYAAGARRASRRVGLMAATFVAVGPIFVWYSQEARPYALLVLLSALSFLFFLRALDAPEGRWFALWAATSLAAVLTHYFAAFLAGAEAVWLLAVHRRRAAAAVSVLAAGTFAILPVALSGPKHVSWIARLPLDLRLAQIPNQFLVGPGEARLRPGWGVIVVAICAATGALVLVRRGDEHEQHAILPPLVIGVCAVAAPLFFTLIGRDYLLARYVIAGELPLVIALASALLPSRGGLLGRGVVAALLLLCGAVSVGVAASPQYQRQNWRAVARTLGTARADRVVIVPEAGRWPLATYAAGMRLVRRGAPGMAVHELAVVTTHARHRSGCWWGGVCDLPERIVLPRPFVAGFQEVAQRRVGAFTIIRFRAGRATTPRLRWGDLLARQNGFSFAVFVERRLPARG